MVPIKKDPAQTLLTVIKQKHFCVLIWKARTSLF